MSEPRVPADEPYESADLALGAVISSWTPDPAAGLGLQRLGPLDTAGMDPTWVLRMLGERLDAEVLLFYGPRAEVMAFQPTDPDLALYVAFEENPTPAWLIRTLDDLSATAGGAPLPSWLRRTDH